MKLSELIRKKEVATATVATLATVAPVMRSSVATVASVAVAAGTGGKPETLQESQESQKSQAGEVLNMKSDAPGTHFMWRLETRSEGALTLTCWPMKTLAEVLKSFPDAVSAEPMPDG